MENQFKEFKQRQSETIGDIAQALCKAQLEMGKLIKNAKNPFFKNNYADLSAVLETCKDQLNNNGICVVQGPCNEGAYVGTTTKLLHKSGQWIESTLLLHPTKADPQGAGSAITYARRYALAAMVGLAQEDDDAEGSVSRHQAPVKKQKTFQQRKAEIESCANHDELADLWRSMSEAEKKSMEDIVAAHGKAIKDQRPLNQ